MKNGIISLLLLGIVAVLLLLGLTIFGPWELPGFGQLSQRQQGQESSAQVFPTPPPDQDRDGFSDQVEGYVGTDKADNCADDVNDAAWPPDINNDKTVNTLDVGAFRSVFSSKVGDANYNRRYDLNADKTINALDVGALRLYFNKGCPFYFLKSAPSVQKVDFSWMPTTSSDITVLLDVIQITGASSVVDCNNPGHYDLNDGYIRQLDSGESSLVWPSQATGPFTQREPESGNEYCAALLKLGQFGYERLHSNPVRFTVRKYNLTAKPSVQKVDFSWNPAIEGSVILEAEPDPVPGGSDCSNFNPNLGDDYIKQLDIGETSVTWPSQSTGPFTQQVPEEGQDYCTVMVRVLNGIPVYRVSDPIKFTVPTTLPSPLPPPPTNNTIIP